MAAGEDLMAIPRAIWRGWKAPAESTEFTPCPWMRDGGLCGRPVPGIDRQRCCSDCRAHRNAPYKVPWAMAKPRGPYGTPGCGSAGETVVTLANAKLIDQRPKGPPPGAITATVTSVAPDGKSFAIRINRPPNPRDDVGSFARRADDDPPPDFDED